MSANLIKGTIAEIGMERQRQDEMWGEQNHDLTFWACIVGEEVGEAIKEIVEIEAGPGSTDKLHTELIQVAAVAISMAECIGREHDVDLPASTKQMLGTLGNSIQHDIKHMANRSYTEWGVSLMGGMGKIGIDTMRYGKGFGHVTAATIQADLTTLAARAAIFIIQENL